MALTLKTGESGSETLGRCRGCICLDFVLLHLRDEQQYALSSNVGVFLKANTGTIAPSILGKLLLAGGNVCVVGIKPGNGWLWQNEIIHLTFLRCLALD